MARPAMRDPSGRWSLAQVAAAAGVTRQTARTLAAAGYVTKDDLGYKDIVMLRVGAALLDSPLPAGETRATAHDTTTGRNFEALRLTRTILDDPTPSNDARLVVTPTTVTLETDPFTLMGLVRAAPVPLLLLPVGAWAIELHELPLTEGKQVAS